MAFLAKIGKALRGLRGSRSLALPDPHRPTVSGGIRDLAAGLNRAESKLRSTGRALLGRAGAATKRALGPEIQSLKSAHDIIAPGGRKLLRAVAPRARGVVAFARAQLGKARAHLDQRQTRQLHRSLDRAVRKGDVAGALQAGQRLEIQKHLHRAAEAAKKGDTRGSLRYLQMASHLERRGGIPGAGKPKTSQDKPTGSHPGKPSEAHQDSGQNGVVKTGRKGGRYVEHNGRKIYVGGAFGPGGGKAKRRR